MRLKPALAVIVLVAAALTPALARVERADACSCKFQPDKVYLKQSDFAFEGTVLSQRLLASEWVAVFEVDEVLKGRPREKAYIRTPLNQAGCGLEFQDGQDYLVFAHERPAKARASSSRAVYESVLCHGSRPLQVP
jgi:hypothetical protein